MSSLNLTHLTKGLLWILLALIFVMAATAETVTASNPETITTEAEETDFQKRIREEQQQLLAKDVPQMDNMAEQVAKGLVFCLAIFFLGVSIMKRRNKSDAKSDIQIVSRQALSSKSALIVVEIEGKRLLLAESTEQLSLLGNMDEGFKSVSLVVTPEERQVA